MIFPNYSRRYTKKPLHNARSLPDAAFAKVLLPIKEYAVLMPSGQKTASVSCQRVGELLTSLHMPGAYDWTIVETLCSPGDTLLLEGF